MFRHFASSIREETIRSKDCCSEPAKCDKIICSQVLSKTGDYILGYCDSERRADQGEANTKVTYKEIEDFVKKSSKSHRIGSYTAPGFLTAVLWSSCGFHRSLLALKIR